MSIIPEAIHSEKQIYYKNYYEEHKEKLSKYNKEYQKDYYRLNKSKFKEYYNNNKEQRRDYQKAYSTNSTLAIREYQSTYWIKRKKIIELKKKRSVDDEIKIEKKQVVITFD